MIKHASSFSQSTLQRVNSIWRVSSKRLVFISPCGRKAFSSEKVLVWTRMKDEDSGGRERVTAVCNGALLAGSDGAGEGAALRWRT